MGGVGRKLWLDGANSFRVWEWFLLLLWKRDFFRFAIPVRKIVAMKQ